jgi:hypothetical protein
MRSRSGDLNQAPEILRAQRRELSPAHYFRHQVRRQAGGREHGGMSRIDVKTRAAAEDRDAVAQAAARHQSRRSIALRESFIAAVIDFGGHALDQ